MIKKITAALFAIAIIATPVTSHSLDYGFTPSHVFSIWKNINKTIDLLSTKYPQEAQVALTAIKPLTYTNKKPYDVLNEASNFTVEFNSLRYKLNLSAIKIDVIPDSEILKITPSQVYIKSGQLLDELVYLMVKGDHSKKISPFYQQLYVTGKTPSDVFALVELAKKKISTLSKYEIIIQKRNDNAAS